MSDVIYKQSPHNEGFTCTDLDKTPPEAVYSVSKEEFQGFGYYRFVSRDNRPTYIKDGDTLLTLHVNENCGYHTTR